MAAYKVYAVEPFGPFDSALIVTASYKNAGGYSKGEWFLIVPDKEGTFFGQAVRFREMEYPADVVQLNDDFVFGEVLDQAKLKLRTFLFERKIDLGGAKSWQLAVDEVDDAYLAHVWVRATCRLQLEKVHAASECEELKVALRRFWDLEPYASRDL